eukprot:scaffold62284_cov61-Attheya_sp.AAC.1
MGFDEQQSGAHDNRHRLLLHCSYQANKSTMWAVRQWHAATIQMIWLRWRSQAFARIPTYRRTDDG